MYELAALGVQVLQLAKELGSLAVVVGSSSQARALQTRRLVSGRPLNMFSSQHRVNETVQQASAFDNCRQHAPHGDIEPLRMILRLLGSVLYPHHRVSAQARGFVVLTALPGAAGLRA